MKPFLRVQCQLNSKINHIPSKNNLPHCIGQNGNVLPAVILKLNLHVTSARNYQLKEETLSIQSILVVAKIVR